MSADEASPRSGPSTAGPSTEGPSTEGPELDHLLSGLDDLAERPVAEHHDRLVEVHEALHAALHQPPTTQASGSTG